MISYTLLERMFRRELNKIKYEIYVYGQVQPKQYDRAIKLFPGEGLKW